MDQDGGVAASGAQLWIVRHGETEWSRSLRHTGVTDVPLTPRGKAAARSLASRLAGTTFRRVLTSPLRRATSTATLAGFSDAEWVDELREWNYGEYEGLTTAEIRVHVPMWSVWTHPCPGGETAAEVAARADAVIAGIPATDGEPTLAFTHGHSGRVLAARWLGLDASDGSMFRLDTAAVSVLGWDKELPSIHRWNA